MVCMLERSIKRQEDKGQLPRLASTGPQLPLGNDGLTKASLHGQGQALPAPRFLCSPKEHSSHSPFSPQKARDSFYTINKNKAFISFCL